jgi:AraC-like DNA-binding protein
LLSDPAVFSVTDPLTAALDELTFRCVPLFDPDEPLRWRRIFAQGVVSIHAVVEGICVIDTDLLLEQTLLHEGEVLVVNGTCRGALRALDGGMPPEVVSARLDLKSRFGHPLLTALPSLMRVASTSMPLAFERCLHSLREELAAGDLGRGSMIGQLCATLFVLTLRKHIDTVDPSRRDWFRMLADPLLREQLTAASNPGTSVGDLASAAGRSRQRTHARFTRFGATRPSLFLRGARVRRAVDLLEAGHADLTLTARESGFGSRQALCRAFRRELGVSPAAHWRATHRRAFPRLSNVRTSR